MIVVDVETTGLDPEKHSIVSIGALDFHNPKNQFYNECRIWDGAEIEQGALEVNGFTEEQVKDPTKMSLEKLMDLFLNWAKDIREITIAGQNPDFDRRFLKVSARRARLQFYFTHRIVDLHSLGYREFLKNKLELPYRDGLTRLNLDIILKYTGLPKEPRPHNALTGAKMEAEAISRLTYGSGLLKEFAQYPLPTHLSKR